MSKLFIHLLFIFVRAPLLFWLHIVKSDSLLFGPDSSQTHEIFRVGKLDDLFFFREFFFLYWNREQQLTYCSYGCSQIDKIF